MGIINLNYKIMGLTTGETDIYSPGGGAYSGMGGFGGLGLVGLIGINSLTGNNGFGNGNGAIPGTTVLEQNVSDLRKDVADNGKEIHVLGNEIAGMFAQQNLAFQGEFRNLDNQICDVEKTLLQQGHAATVLAMQNTQAIQSQMSGFQHEVDKQFCGVETAIHADGDLTRALLNQTKIDDLRDQLELERRGRRDREIEINISNSATATAQQFQQQFQQQTGMIATCLNSLGDQINRQTNQLINVGSGTVAGNPQTATNANTKIS